MAEIKPAPKKHVWSPSPIFNPSPGGGLKGEAKLRGYQAPCRRCPKDCKVLAGKRSYFYCADTQKKGGKKQ